MTPPSGRPYDTRHWRALRKHVIARDGGCVVCGSTLDLDVDHIQPWQDDPGNARGTWYAESNLRTLCRLCHNRKPSRHRRRTPRTPTPRPTPGSNGSTRRITPVHRDW